MGPHLPLDIARCEPQAVRCPQFCACARATDWPRVNRALQVIDASVLLTSRQRWCPMFIDRRAAELRHLEAA